MERFRKLVEDDPHLDTSELDGSIESLGVVWRWFLDHHRHRSPVPLDALEEDALPWWACFTPPIVAEIGIELTWLADGLAAYYVHCLVQQRPDAFWALSSAEEEGPIAADYRQPHLHLPGRGDLYPVGVARKMVRLSTKTPSYGFDHPDRLERAARQFLGLIDQPAPAPEPPWMSIDDFTDSDERPHPEHQGRFFTVSFSDDVAHHHDHLLDTITRALDEHPAVRRAYREDTELINVLAEPNVTERQLHDLVDAHRPADS